VVEELFWRFSDGVASREVEAGAVGGGEDEEGEEEGDAI
jgi:hypothetical protein